MSKRCTIGELEDTLGFKRKKHTIGRETKDLGPQLKALNDGINDIKTKYYILSRGDIPKSEQLNTTAIELLDRLGATVWPPRQERPWLISAKETGHQEVYPQDLYFVQHRSIISKTFVKLVIEKTIAYKENKKAAARRKQGENAVDRLSSQEAGLSFSVSALRPRTSSVSSSESDKESITAWHGDLRPNLQHKYIKAQSMARQHAAPVAYMARDPPAAPPSSVKQPKQRRDDNTPQKPSQRPASLDDGDDLYGTTPVPVGGLLEQKASPILPETTERSSRPPQARQTVPHGFGPQPQKITRGIPGSPATVTPSQAQGTTRLGSDDQLEHGSFPTVVQHDDRVVDSRVPAGRDALENRPSSISETAALYRSATEPCTKTSVDTGKGLHRASKVSNAEPGSPSLMVILKLTSEKLQSLSIARDQTSPDEARRTSFTAPSEKTSDQQKFATQLSKLWPLWDQNFGHDLNPPSFSGNLLETLVQLARIASSQTQAIDMVKAEAISRIHDPILPAGVPRDMFVIKRDVVRVTASMRTGSSGHSPVASCGSAITPDKTGKSPAEAAHHAPPTAPAQQGCLEAVRPEENQLPLQSRGKYWSCLVRPRKADLVIEPVNQDNAPAPSPGPQPRSPEKSPTPHRSHSPLKRDHQPTKKATLHPYDQPTDPTIIEFSRNENNDGPTEKPSSDKNTTKDSGSNRHNTAESNSAFPVSSFPSTTSVSAEDIAGVKASLQRARKRKADRALLVEEARQRTEELRRRKEDEIRRWHEEAERIDAESAAELEAVLREEQAEKADLDHLADL